MKHILSILIAVITITGCNDNTAEDKTSNTTVVKSTPPSGECYVGTSGKDSILLNFTSNNDKVTGQLSYLFSEKDRNNGTIDGAFHGDTLFADYSFTSEGMVSKRQVVFLKKDSKLAEGYGDMNEEGNKFKSPASLSFGKGFILEKTDCK